LERIVLRFDSADYELNDPLKGRNIEGYDASGQLLWRIQGTGVTFKSS